MLLEFLTINSDLVEYKFDEELNAVTYLLQKAWENGKEFLKLPKQISTADSTHGLNTTGRRVSALRSVLHFLCHLPWLSHINVY